MGAYEEAATTGRLPLALHACCGPCSLEPVKLLREEGFEPVIFWCNPNIQPAAEHDLRLVTLLTWAREAQVRVVRTERGGGSGITGTPSISELRERWEYGVAPHGFDREARCRACYAERLAITCDAACELGFTHVSTTLAVSPYQLFDTCSEVLERLAAAHGLTPVVRDFRPYYPEATRESRELGMYRQNYCGCRISAAEAAIERHERRDERKREKAAARAAKAAARATARAAGAVRATNADQAANAVCAANADQAANTNQAKKTNEAANAVDVAQNVANAEQAAVLVQAR